VSSGDVIGARDMLAAAKDCAHGLVTFALAETYDPNMLSALGSRGVTSDVVRAKALYGKALELGVAKANARLEGLNLLSPASRTDTSAKSALTISVATRCERSRRHACDCLSRYSRRRRCPANASCKFSACRLRLLCPRDTRSRPVPGPFL
jgi:hypothetical protein